VFKVVLVGRFLALLLAALVLLEGSGFARAFGEGATVHCCCGSHSAARRCRCKACPTARRGTPPRADGDRLAASRECDGVSGDAGVLVIVAVPVPAAPAAPILPPAVRVLAVAPSPLVTRPLDFGRPPP
jgi:hypothetical protein